MRISLKIKKNDIFVVLLIIMVVGSSWDMFFGTSYIDEIALLGLLVFAMFFRLRINTLSICCISIYACICVLGMVREHGQLIDVFNYVKCMLMFVLVPQLGLSDENIIRIFAYFKYSNVISVAIGIINYINYNILHAPLLFESGNLKYIDGGLVHRMSGLCSFSGVMATICLFLLVCSLFKTEKTTIDYFWSIYWFIGLYCTKGRFSLFFAIVFIAYYTWIHVPYNTRKRLLPVILLTVIAVVVFVIPKLYDVILTEFASDFENQIRWRAYSKINDLFDSNFWAPLNLLVGVGIGYLGTVYESHFAITFIETGAIGLLAWYIPLIFYLFRLLKQQDKGDDNITVMILLVFYMINSLINKSYDVPYLPMMCVFLNTIRIRRMVESNPSILKKKTIHWGHVFDDTDG